MYENKRICIMSEIIQIPRPFGWWKRKQFAYSVYAQTDTQTIANDEKHHKNGLAAQTEWHKSRNSESES